MNDKARVTAESILEANNSIIIVLMGRLSMIQSQEKIEGASPADIAKVTEAVCRIGETVARIRRDAFMVEAGIQAQREVTGDAAKTMVARMMQERGVDAGQLSTTLKKARQGVPPGER